MEKETLKQSTQVAYLFLDKACDESTQISYDKLQCMVYQSNKSYLHYEDRLLCDINTITSHECPINMDILRVFSQSKNKEYIPHVKGMGASTVGSMESVFLEYIWYKYSSMKDEELLKHTLNDKVFQKSSGTNITIDDLKSEEQDASIKQFMDFLTK